MIVLIQQSILPVFDSLRVSFSHEEQLNSPTEHDIYEPVAYR